MKKFKRFFTKVIIILVIVTVYASICISKILLNLGEANFEAQISTASYISIGKVLNEESFSDLFSYQKDGDGNIVLISTNSLKINRLTKRLADSAFEAYDVLASGGVAVPLGAFTGVSFLSGLGKRVNLKLITVNSVRCEFRTEFESAGINQTRQSMYLKIIPDCTIVAGLSKKQLEKQIEFLCFENFVIGRVPNTYVNVSGYTANSSKN